MPLVAPPPKPGRIRVYRVISQFQAQKPTELDLTGEDIVFLSEPGPAQKLCDLKCGGKTGKFPKELMEEHLELIEFPLHEAAKMGDWEFLHECLENGVSVNGLDKSGSTALHWAAYTGHTEVVNNLLATTDIAYSAQNKLGDTPLHAASAKGRLDCVEFLVGAGANVHKRNGQGKLPAEVAATPEIGAFLRTIMKEPGHQEADYLDDDEEEVDEN